MLGSCDLFDVLMNSFVNMMPCRYTAQEMKKVTASCSKYEGGGLGPRFSVFTAITCRAESTVPLPIPLASFQAETSGRLAQWLSTCTVGTQDHVGSDNVSQISKEILPARLF